MKRLLLLLPLLLLASCKPAEPPKPTLRPETEPEKVEAAKSVDYVKCEAMQKALKRVTNTRLQQATAVWDSNLRAVKIKECGPRPSMSDKKYDRWYWCTNDAESREFENLKEAQQLAMKKIDAQLEQIEADYKAEGCY